LILKNDKTINGSGRSKVR